jgi:hypothetical protein
MQNLHDDKYLDDLSRRAAEDYEPDQDLHSWESLRPGLEAALPQKKERKRRFLVWFLLFLLVGGGVVFSTVWNEQPETASNKLPAGSNAEEKPVAVKQNASKEKPAASKESSAQSKDQSTASNQKPVASENASPGNTNQPAPVTPQQTSSPENETSGTKKNTTTTTSALIDEPASIGQSNKNKKPTPARNITSNNTKNTTPRKALENNDVVNFGKPEERTIKAAHINDGLAKFLTPRFESEKIKINQLPVTLDAELKTPIKRSPALKNRWEFGAVYAPDVSTVRFTHTQKPGTNFGVTIAYNVSKRFAIQAGAIYTTKNYKITGKDFHPPKGYWTDYVTLETVTGDCTMWDIPLNLRYNVAPGRVSNLFASAGVSSYLMQEEDYDYFYYYNGNPMTRNRSYDSDSKHWFGVLNLSVAYERRVGRNIWLQAEPFYKQPLKGVGFGSIKLNTTGIYFSLKYKPFSR